MMIAKDGFMIRAMIAQNSVLAGADRHLKRRQRIAVPGITSATEHSRIVNQRGVLSKTSFLPHVLEQMDKWHQATNRKPSYHRTQQGHGQGHEDRTESVRPLHGFAV